MIRALLACLSLACCCQASEARRWADYWANYYAFEREFIHAVIEAESAWNPRAVSSAGAVGLMQLMPDTAVAYGVRNRFNIQENIRGGVAYLAWLRKLCYGDRRLVLASYNAGHKRVLPKGLYYSSPEVHSYVQRVAYLYRRNRWETLLREKGETAP